MNLLYIHPGKITSQKANIIQVVEMCNAFNNNGIEVTLALPDSRELTSSIDVYFEQKFGYKLSFKIVFFPQFTFLNKFKILGNVPGINKFLKKHNYHYIFTRDIISAIISWRHATKLIFEFHHIRFHDNSFLNSFYTWNIKKFGRSNNFYPIFISMALKTWWEKAGLKNKSSIVLHDAFNPDKYIIKETNEELRKNFGFTIQDKIVTYTGSLYKDREIENILLLAEYFTNVKFLVVGGPDKRKKFYEKLAFDKKISNINFRGYVPHKEVSKYLIMSDVLLMTWSNNVATMNYCSPMKVFEYMAAGKIIVGHGYPTIKEVLTDNINAILVTPDSYKELEKKLEYALENLNFNKKIGMNAKKMAYEKYTWNYRAKRILEKLH